MEKANDCDDHNYLANPGNLGIKDRSGAIMTDFQNGFNWVTMDPSCPSYYSYTFLETFKNKGIILTIHQSYQDAESTQSTQSSQGSQSSQASEAIGTGYSTYWFFGQPSGNNFMIHKGVPYRVFREE